MQFCFEVLYVRMSFILVSVLTGEENLNLKMHGDPELGLILMIKEGGARFSTAFVGAASPSEM